LQTAIATIGPIAISIAASSDAFQNYGGGVLQYTNDWDVDHAVQVCVCLFLDYACRGVSIFIVVSFTCLYRAQAVGYGIATDYFNVGYWLVRNSWDSTWGDYGYVRVFRQTDGKTPEDCGTDYSPEDGDGCPGGPGDINVCGEIGILSDSSYPFGGHLVTEK
jgi:hypothetical protein